MKFILKKPVLFFLIAAILVFAFCIVFEKTKPEFFNPHIYFSLAYFFGVNALAIPSILKKLDSAHKNAFTFSFLTFTGLKMFINLFIILIYALVNKSQLFTFAIGFLIQYFIFMFLEVYYLMQVTKNHEN